MKVGKSTAVSDAGGDRSGLILIRGEFTDDEQEMTWHWT